MHVARRECPPQEGINGAGPAGRIWGFQNGPDFATFGVALVERMSSVTTSGGGMIE